MTTRAQLESEREALVELRRYCTVGATPPHAALTASIARVEALLSLSDEQCAYLVKHEIAIAYADEPASTGTLMSPTPTTPMAKIPCASTPALGKLFTSGRRAAALRVHDGDVRCDRRGRGRSDP